MIRWVRVAVLICLALAAGCAPVRTPVPSAQAPATRTPSSPGLSITSVPDAGPAARAFLDAWRNDDYSGMYARLTNISKDAISLEEFEKHYRGVASEMALSGIDTVILSSLVLSPLSAQVSYQVTFHSTLVGDLHKDTLMNLSLEGGEWRVQWDYSLVMPELAGGNYLSMERTVPARANIYDRNGHALVAQADVTAIGLIPNQILPEQEAELFTWLERLTGQTADQIRARYASFPPGEDWYLPLGEVQVNAIANNFELLSTLNGLVLEPYKARYYFDGGIAPHIIGYVTTIQAGEEEDYLRRGYRRDERVGQSGLEKWGESYLSGTRGGALYVFGPDGKIFTRLGEKDPQPAAAIYTTMNREFQIEVQRALEGFRGAAVVLERDTGRVLALASSPAFDPNAFEPTNRNFSYLLDEIFNDPATPTFNRAAQGQYPPGSAFKIITMAAALESGDYTAESTYQCGYFFNELAGVTLHDWTYTHYMLDGKTIPSGLLTLPEGLVRSCNPWFWHIGLDFYTRGMTETVASMARGFGLGSPTGIEGIPEAPGNVPVPGNEVDATNLAIGQGETLVTPLQAAVFAAALGNGGTLYRPQLVERVAPPDGDPLLQFKPVVNGKLPISQEALKIIQDALRGVVVSTRPYGTAWHRFTGLDIPVAGKTGTAESGSGAPHAWFVGYTFADRENTPDIAIAVVVENIGEGSDYAAPIFRRIVELYFYSQPARLYPWESGFYSVRTPEPDTTGTPAP